MRVRGTRWGIFISLVVLACGCGRTVEFRTSYPDNQPSHVAEVLERLGPPQLPSSPDNVTGQPLVVVALHGDDEGLVAFAADTGEELWRRSMAVDSRAEIGGPVVVVRSDQEIVGLSVRDGQPLWRRPAETIDYVGAAVDSGVVVLAFSTAGQQASMFREGRLVALDALSGRELWTLGPVEKQLASPAASSGVLFVPWDRLSISAFDIETGRELARLLSRDDVFSFVRAGPAGVFYGSTGVYRLTEQSASGSREESVVFEPLVGNAPVSEGIEADGFLAQTGGRNARNKIRFLWRGAPSTGEQVDLFDDTLYFLYYRIVFAFDAGTGRLRWVCTTEQDIEAAAVVSGGLLLIDGQGGLRGLSAESGETSFEADLEVPVANASFDVPGMPSGEPQGDAPSTAVRQQLRAVIFDPDARLAPARRFAVAVLASMPEPEVTRDLLEVCRCRRIPEAIRNDAAMVLRTRQVGSRYLVEALEDHYDFLEDTQAPPVGVIASAVLHMDERSALDPLFEHLLDPETPREDLAPVAEAVAEFGEARLVPELRRFIVRYHADSEFNQAESILLELARAVALYGDDDDRAALAALADDSSTLHRLARNLEAALEVTEPEQEGAPESAEEDQPAQLPQRSVGQVMESARARIRPCIQGAIQREPGLSQVELSLLVDEQGELIELTVEPHDDVLASCLSLSLAQFPFPRGMGERRAVYTIGIEH